MTPGGRTARLAVLAVALAAALAAPAGGQTSHSVDLAAARALVARVVPANASDIDVAAIPDSAGHDVFEVQSQGGKLVLRGSSGVAIASALDWYLEHVAGVNASLPLTPITLRTPLPRVQTPVRITTPYTVRYFFNYCTFSYSMAWWNWTDWQPMIDWMALKGINAPLAVTGQEGVWRLVLHDFGFTSKQIGDFLVGPAYLPWGWMANIDGLGGPLPDSWIDGHIALERQILSRERSLGMTPVLQGFTGHVPKSITQVFPGVAIHQTGDWSAGFPGTWFLDPHDSLFQRFGRQFIKRQTELFGTDHLYAADPFNEINPPTNDSTFIAGMGSAIYAGMHSADSSATWVIQAWFLVNDAKFWQAPQAEALLGAVPNDRMLVLDLWGDRVPAWKVRDAFYGKPWIWNVLYNFGGKTSLNGDLPQIAANLDSAIRSPAKGRLEGLGMTMEGLGTNPIVPDFVMDQVWRDSVPNVTTWTRGYVTRRYGRFDASAWSAWQLLLATAFKSAAQTGNFLAERPQFYMKGRSYRTEPIAPYDDRILANALDSLLAAAPVLGANDAYRYDVVNLTRQVLGQLGLPLVNKVQAAYGHKDRAALLAAEGQVEALLTDLDTLVGTRREFLLGRWIADARRWGTNDAERRLYEWNARNIITLWGTKCTEGENDDLNLYAYKEWEGMFTSYFLPRWEAFFAQLNSSFDGGTAFDRKPFAEVSCEWEQLWSRDTTPFRTQPVGDPVATAQRLVGKWRGELAGDFEGSP
ncbi:MAG TPA: alpha-N-acetylglucosaminidase [Gemmatimonadaceae bacterium]|nr:alpha-N-acetylglucosaminidase [Gemmatimonadaceae bacterium]